MPVTHSFEGHVFESKPDLERRVDPRVFLVPNKVDVVAALPFVCTSPRISRDLP